MMSATENQASRKGEFNQTVEEQFRKGRVQIELKDRTGNLSAQPGTKMNMTLLRSLGIIKDNQIAPATTGK